MSSPAQTTEACAFYVAGLGALIEAGIPFLVGGAYALEKYTGIARDTKDLDVFVRPRDCVRALQHFAATGLSAEVKFPHWLGKVRCGDEVIDVIFSSGNGFAQVDDAWFEHAVEATVLGQKVALCPPEETIWSKAFIMERERFDGADVLHLLRAMGPQLDWPRMLRRFGSHWHVLLSHLVLFTFVYPSERDRIPTWVMRELVGRLQNELRQPPPVERLCRGTLLSRAQYLVDIEALGYQDGRLAAPATMTPEEIATWTAAIETTMQPRLAEPDAHRGDR